MAPLLKSFQAEVVIVCSCYYKILNSDWLSDQALFGHLLHCLLVIRNSLCLVYWKVDAVAHEKVFFSLMDLKDNLTD